jgi:PAS domain S-box-containing protein
MLDTYEELCDMIGECIALYEVKSEGNKFFFKKVNKALEKTEKLSKEEIIGKEVTKVFPGVKDMGLLDVFKRVYKTGKPERLAKTKYKDKRITGIRTNNVYKLKSGDIVSVYRDDTSGRKTELELQRLAKIYEQSPILIIVTDPKGNIEYVNPKFTQTTGYTFEEVKGKNPRVLKSGYTKSEVYEGLWKTVLSGQVWSGEFYNKKKNGGAYWASATISAIFDSKGNIINIVGMQEDITERKKAEVETKKFNEIAIDRELKMVELKKEINELKRRLGEKAKYIER